MPGDKKGEGEWAVFDTLARGTDDKGEPVPRVHEARAGKPYKLFNSIPCWMPESDARVFLKDPAFTVWNNDEEVVPPLPKQAMVRTVRADELPPNCVVADLNELTSDALLTRAAQRPGGQRFTGETRREALVRFLMDDHSAQMPTTATARPAIQAPADDPVEVDEGGEDGEDAAKILMGA